MFLFKTHDSAHRFWVVVVVVFSFKRYKMKADTNERGCCETQIYLSYAPTHALSQAPYHKKRSPVLSQGYDEYLLFMLKRSFLQFAPQASSVQSST